MTSEERAVMVVRARLAGVHPLWIKWFSRGEYDCSATWADNDLEYVVSLHERGETTWGDSPGKRNHSVWDYLRVRGCE